MGDKEYCERCEKYVETKHEVNETLDDGTEADYYAYCKECGSYVHHFCYGHIEY